MMLQAFNFSNAKDFTNKPVTVDPYYTRRTEAPESKIGAPPTRYIKPEKVKFSSVGENKEYFINA
jgi:hypothetical protein